MIQDASAKKERCAGEILNKCHRCLIEGSAKSALLENLLFLPRRIGILHSHTHEMRGFLIHLHKGNQNMAAHDLWQIRVQVVQRGPRAEAEEGRRRWRSRLLHGIHHMSVRVSTPHSTSTPTPTLTHSPQLHKEDL